MGKVPYARKYETAKSQYDKDMEAFLAGGGVKEKGIRAQRTEKRKAKDGKKKKDPNAPKKPAGGAYGVFLAENREKILKSLPTDHKMVDVAKAAGAQFKSLSEAAKKPYEEKYQKLAAQWKIAMEEYKKTHGAEDGNEDDDDDDEEDEEGEDEEEEDVKVAAKKARKAGA